jgi:hypothetical protein
MGKDNEKNLTGQPIFNQLLKMIPKEVFDRVVMEQKSDYRCRTFSTWDELVTLLFGIFERCDSAREVCDGMAALGGKLNYLGWDVAPAKSTFNDALSNRNAGVFERVYFALLDYFSEAKPDSRKENIPFEEFYAFDSTTISLFSNVLKGVGRNPKGDGKKKGGLKVHMLTDIHADAAKFVKISEAKQHDKNFLQYLTLPPGSMIVFDKAYNHYWQFAKWTQEGVFFVCRLKDNAKYDVVGDVLYEKTLLKGEAGVMKEEHIHLKYASKKGQQADKTLCLRKVTYRDEQRRIFRFICNNWDITTQEVALIYKNRWSIELVFKKLKQNFQLHFFYSESENGIKTQVWATLIAYLLLTVLKQRSKSEKAFSTIAALIRIHLISHLDLFWLIKNGRRTYAKNTKSRNKNPAAAQLNLF